MRHADGNAMPEAMRSANSKVVQNDAAFCEGRSNCITRRTGVFVTRLFEREELGWVVGVESTPKCKLNNLTGSGWHKKQSLDVENRQTDCERIVRT